MRGGLVGVWVAARANQGDHFCVRGDLLRGVGKIAGGGEDGEFVVPAVACAIRTSRGIGTGVVAAGGQGDQADQGGADGSGGAHGFTSHRVPF